MSTPPTPPAAAWWHVDVTPDGFTFVLTPEVYEMHGRSADGDLHGYDLVRAGHREDVAERAVPSQAALDRGRAFAHQRPLVRADGEEIQVLALGVGDYDEDGRLVGVNGVYLDVRSAVQDTVTAEVTAQLGEVIQAREGIEQAKGVLMLAYGLDVDAAFRLLGWYSQRTNTRVRTIADRLAAGAAGRPADPADLDAYLAGILDERAIGVPAVRPEGTPTGLPPEVVSRRLDGHTVLSVLGDCDAARADALLPALRDALGGVVRPQRLHVLDLARVGYLSPVAVSGIVSAVSRHKGAGADVRVLAGPAGHALVAAGLDPQLLVD